MKNLFVTLSCLLLSLSVHAQSFLLSTSQLDISTVPAYSHAPLQVDIVTNQPGFNFSALRVSSDSSWVAPAVDSTNSRISLSFATSNLIAQTQTATITVANNTMTNTFFVKTHNVSQNITRLVDDPTRSRIYGIHQNGTALGSVVVYDPQTGSPLANITTGNKPTDLAVSANGQELLVINSADKTISAINLATLQVTETISLPVFSNWGVDSTTADIGIGPGSVIYYSDGAWAPVLHVFNRNTKTVLQSVTIDGYGFGDFAISSNFSSLFGWVQYGWSAGWAGSYLAQYSINTNGTLNFQKKTSSTYPTVLGRDPLNTPVLIDNRNNSIFVKNLQCNASSVNSTMQAFPTDIYSISPGGEIAATKSSVYETKTGIKLLDMPRAAEVQTVTSDYGWLVYFDTSAKELKTINLLSAISADILNRNLSPADGSITLAPDTFQWSPVPGVDCYHVYLGTNESAVISANTNSASFLGEVNTPDIAVNGGFSAGITYFWRVDPIAQTGIETGAVHRFTVATVSTDTPEVQAVTVQGHANCLASINLISAVATGWQATSDSSWVSFVTNSGTTPAKLDLVLNAASLPVGVHSATVTLSGTNGTFFTLPVSFRVEPLKLTIIKSDPSSVFAYAVSEDISSAAPRAYLLEINTLTEKISRAVYVGQSVTDLAIHHGDNRIYVPNWQPGSLVVVDLTTFKQVRSYGFSPGACYRVSAGIAGRVVIEAEDQWINVSIFDTFTGTILSNTFEREGGGQCDPTGRYYYHGDNNISDASIHKFDLTGDSFAELAGIRVTSGGYYGSRTVVVSDDGNRVFWNGSVFDKNLVEEWQIGEIIYSCSPDGRYAVAADNIYDIVQKKIALRMPVSTTVSTINSSSKKLAAQMNDKICFFDVSNPGVLPTPVLSASNITYHSAALIWTDASLETGFTLQQKTAGTSEWVTVGAGITPNTTRYMLDGLTPLTAYEFRIKADSSVGSSLWSQPVTIITPAAPPTTPVLNIPSTDFTSINLSWSNSSYEDSYILERSDSVVINWSILATIPADTLTYTDTAVTQGASYTYRVKAVNSAQESSYSNIRTATVPVPPPPETPSGLIAKPVSMTEISVTWENVANETGYRLERRTEDPDSWVTIANLSADISCYSDTHVIQKTEYWYRVIAFNSIGDSGYSNEDRAIANNIIHVMDDDFDPDLNPAMWTAISGGVATNIGTGFLSNNALWFTQSGTRSATTIPMDLTLGGTLEFKMRAGNEPADGWNNSESGETVALEYSTDGTTWNELQSINTVYPELSAWTSFSIDLPDTAQGSQVRIRWRQLRHSGATFDVWAIEDVSVLAAAPEPPGAVPFIIGAANSDRAVSILWIGAPRASSYFVERSVLNGTWQTIAQLPESETYFIDNNLTPETLYRYRVKAANAGGESPYSAVSGVATLSQIEGWLRNNFDTSEPRENGAPLAKDTDGLDMLQKYAFNLQAGHPAERHIISTGNSGLPAIWVDPSTKRMCAEFVRRKANSNPGITYLVEYCETLGGTWRSITDTATATDIDIVWERVRFEACPSTEPCANGFMRIRVRLDSNQWMP